MENSNTNAMDGSGADGQGEGEMLPVIYGITEPPSEYGLQAYAIDGATGEVIAQHFCSSEGFAKSDLGFSGPLLQFWQLGDFTPHSTVGFNEERLKCYQERFPDGFRLEWIGPWRGHPVIESLRNALTP